MKFNEPYDLQDQLYFQLPKYKHLIIDKIQFKIYIQQMENFLDHEVRLAKNIKKKSSLCFK